MKTKIFTIMKKLLWLLVALMAMMFWGSANCYAGCGGPNAGVRFEDGDFYYKVVSVPPYPDPYESEISSHSTSSIYNSSCYDDVIAGAPYSGNVIVPSSTTRYFIAAGDLNFITVGIGEKAFADCPNLNSVTIPNSVTYVSDSAFARSLYLNQVTFGTGVITLGNGIFKGCYSLQSVTFKGAVPYGLNASQFADCINLETIYVPSDKITVFQRALGSSFNVVAIPSPEDNVPQNVLDFTTQGTSINDWIINYATLNESNTNEDAGKFVYDIHGGIESESYVVSRPNIVFKVKNASDKQKAFVIYPGQGYEFGGKNGVICINGTSAGDRIRITCAAKGSTNASFEDGQGVYPKNAITITEDLTLPYKAEGAEDADEQGYRWKEIQYVSLGGDVEIKEFAGGFRVKRVEVEESGITTPTYTITADASPSYAGTVNVTYSADHTQATMTAMPNDGYYFDHWNDGNTENPRTVMLTQDIMYTAYFETDNSTPAALPFEETFTTRRGTTYIEKTDKGYWPYANEWFEGYTSESGRVDGNQYDNDYTSVSSYGVTIRGRKLNDEIVNTVGLYFTFNRSADKCFVKFSGGLPMIPAGGAYLHFEICSSESDGGDLDAMIVKVNDAVVAIPHIELGGQRVTSIVTVPLNAGRLTSLSFAFDNVPSQKFINRFWIDYSQSGEPPVMYSVTTNAYPLDAGTVQVAYNSNHSQATMTAIGNTGYHFKRWSDGNLDNPRYVELTQDTTFTALFELDVLEVTYIGMDGRVLGVESVQYGSQARQRGIDTDEFGYTLVGWNEDLSYVTTDMTVTAIYQRDAVNGFYYIYDRDAKTAVLDHEGNSYANIRKLNVPNNFIYRGIKFAVVAVGANAFENCDRLTDVVLPGNVEDVEEYAFSGCTDLVHLTMSANLRSIADYAFNGCKRLEDITVYAQRVPDLTATSFNAIGNKKYVNVYVPDNRVNNYKRDEYWSEFNIVVKSAETVEGNVNDVTVEPEETSAQFTWPTENNAASYTIEITKDGVVFCTLIFNANGQLTGIAFAPGRNGNEAPMATLTTNGGMQFTVTGLDAGTSYAYTVTTKNQQDRVIATFEGSFETTGSMEDGIVAIDANTAPQKIMHNGQIYILRGEKVFTLQGVEVK